MKTFVLHRLSDGVWLECLGFLTCFEGISKNKICKADFKAPLSTFKTEHGDRTRTDGRILTLTWVWVQNRKSHQFSVTSFYL